MRGKGGLELMHRRYSMPEIVMRKYSLSKQRTEPSESPDTMEGRSVDNWSQTSPGGQAQILVIATPDPSPGPTPGSYPEVRSLLGRSRSYPEVGSSSSSAGGRPYSSAERIPWCSSSGGDPQTSTSLGQSVTERTTSTQDSTLSVLSSVTPPQPPVVESETSYVGKLDLVESRKNYRFALSYSSGDSISRESEAKEEETESTMSTVQPANGPSHKATNTTPGELRQIANPKEYYSGTSVACQTSAMSHEPDRADILEFQLFGHREEAEIEAEPEMEPEVYNYNPTNFRGFHVLPTVTAPTGNYDEFPGLERAVPRYWAIPRTGSMLVNTSSIDEECTSGSSSLISEDSLEEEPMCDHRLRYPPTRHDDRPVRGEVNTREEINTRKKYIKSQNTYAYFLFLSGEEDTIREYGLPEKLRTRLRRREEEIKKHFEAKFADSLNKKPIYRKRKKFKSKSAFKVTSDTTNSSHDRTSKRPGGELNKATQCGDVKESPRRRGQCESSGQDTGTCPVGEGRCDPTTDRNSSCGKTGQCLSKEIAGGSEEDKRIAKILMASLNVCENNESEKTKPGRKTCHFEMDKNVAFKILSEDEKPGAFESKEENNERSIREVQQSDTQSKNALSASHVEPSSRIRDENVEDISIVPKSENHIIQVGNIEAIDPPNTMTNSNNTSDVYRGAQEIVPAKESRQEVSTGVQTSDSPTGDIPNKELLEIDVQNVSLEHVVKLDTICGTLDGCEEESVVEEAKNVGGGIRNAVESMSTGVQTSPVPSDGIPVVLEQENIPQEIITNILPADLGRDIDHNIHKDEDPKSINEAGPVRLPSPGSCVNSPVSISTWVQTCSELDENETINTIVNFENFLLSRSVQCSPDHGDTSLPLKKDAGTSCETDCSDRGDVCVMPETISDVWGNSIEALICEREKENDLSKGVQVPSGCLEVSSGSSSPVATVPDIVIEDITDSSPDESRSATYGLSAASDGSATNCASYLSPSSSVQSEAIRSGAKTKNRRTRADVLEINAVSCRCHMCVLEKMTAEGAATARRAYASTTATRDKRQRKDSGPDTARGSARHINKRYTQRFEVIPEEKNISAESPTLEEQCRPLDLSPHWRKQSPGGVATTASEPSGVVLPLQEALAEQDKSDQVGTEEKTVVVNLNETGGPPNKAETEKEKIKHSTSRTNSKTDLVKRQVHKSVHNRASHRKPGIVIGRFNRVKEKDEGPSANRKDDGNVDGPPPSPTTDSNRFQPEQIAFHGQEELLTLSKGWINFYLLRDSKDSSENSTLSDESLKSNKQAINIVSKGSSPVAESNPGADPDMVEQYQIEIGALPLPESSSRKQRPNSFLPEVNRGAGGHPSRATQGHPADRKPPAVSTTRLPTLKRAANTGSSHINVILSSDEREGDTETPPTTPDHGTGDEFSSSGSRRESKQVGGKKASSGRVHLPPPRPQNKMKESNKMAERKQVQRRDRSHRVQNYDPNYNNESQTSEKGAKV
ncbi:hypothetical protein AAG570_008824 [Ranatra chinensis]|uniref:Uncharacterized protein n=1 Tax=Ranatra chinensis TaxID=642074 RepID=A0ABD0Z2P1_9HEMI